MAQREKSSARAPRAERPACKRTRMPAKAPRKSDRRRESRHDPESGTQSQRSVAVTVVRVTPVRVVQVKTPELDGYSAVQVTYGSQAARHPQQASRRPLRQSQGRPWPGPGRAEGGRHPIVLGRPGARCRHLHRRRQGRRDRRPARATGSPAASKRHNFRGQGASHGNHKHHRAPGSVGACATPARVFKGHPHGGPAR